MIQKAGRGGFEPFRANPVLASANPFKPCSDAAAFRERHGIIEPIQGIQRTGGYWRKARAN
jgi:hypothetical protein